MTTPKTGLVRHEVSRPRLKIKSDMPEEQFGKKTSKIHMIYMEKMINTSLEDIKKRGLSVKNLII